MNVLRNAFPLVLVLAACSSSHTPNDVPDSAVVPDTGVQDLGAADGSVTVSCEGTLLPQSAFRPDSLYNVREGGVVVSRRTGSSTGGAFDRPAPEPADPAPIPIPADAGTPSDGGGGLIGNCGGDPIDGYAWDGHRCRGVLTTFCEATGSCTNALFATDAACADAHAACVPEQCRDTGGVWSEFAIRCSAPACGTFFGGDCDGPNSPQCVCPVGESFGESGCAPSAACEPARLENGCHASGGLWYENHCGDYSCGNPSPLTCVSPGCDCGPHMNFDRDAAKCVPDGTCGFDAVRLCAWSGGNWNESNCGPTTCGVPSGAECASGGCDCGADSVFDENVGCVLAPHCRTNMCF
jgi:hypothetical protein